jgi:hypothetical protein
MAFQKFNSDPYQERYEHPIKDGFNIEDFLDNPTIEEIAEVKDIISKHASLLKDRDRMIVIKKYLSVQLDEVLKELDSIDDSIGDFIKDYIKLDK